MSNSGARSALKVIVNTHPETSVIPKSVVNGGPTTGLMMNIHHPYEWPSAGIFIAVGSKVALTIKPTAFSTSDEVQGLSPDERQCNYDVSLL